MSTFCKSRIIRIAVSLLLCLLIIRLGASAQSERLQPVGPVPSAQQVAWQDMEFCLFMHFGPNTFTDLEWGKGTESEKVFNPTALDCRQWCRIARAAGAKGIIITAKHHDGFCLWPSKYSTHTVRESPWKNGQGDVLRELSDACREYGLKFGVYISPWDRNHPAYGTPTYNDVFVNMMKEIFSNCGPIYELWWDGANGEGPDGKKQVYDFRRYENAIREISPKTVIFSDIGPDIRWVGNEDGEAGETNWNLLDTAGFGRGATAPPTDTLNRGNENGKYWIPAECDVSIRPGWFYHPKDDSAVKQPDQLMNLWLHSVGRGANLLLNVPPNRDGLISFQDSASLIGFKFLRDHFFGNNLAKSISAVSSSEKIISLSRILLDGDPNTYWIPDDGSVAQTLEIELPSTMPFNTVVMKEFLPLGQRIESFSIDLMDGGKWVPFASGTTVGHERIIPSTTVMSDKIRINILKSKSVPVLSEVGVYNSASGKFNPVNK
ncbi:MAG TPA: alpha-L-fucosidase [Bacteroidota bacterium]|nr:alpha-L-fucosidase [Bacteroidota bacterium]